MNTSNEVEEKKIQNINMITQIFDPKNIRVKRKKRYLYAHRYQFFGIKIWAKIKLLIFNEFKI